MAEESLASRMEMYNDQIQYWEDEDTERYHPEKLPLNPSSCPCTYCKWARYSVWGSRPNAND